MQNRVLEAGPGGRGALALRRAEGAPERPEHGRALVRNLLTLIYPGFDLGEIERADREGATLPLGRLAIGRVRAVDAVAGEAGLQPEQLIYWSGPHADWAELDPARHAWTLVAEADPRILAAGIGAEAELGLDLALAGTGWPEGAPARAIVIGQGMLGHLAGRLLRMRGSHVVVVENSPKRLEFSKYQGLTLRVDTHATDWRSRVGTLLGGEADLLVEASGNPLSTPGALAFLRPGGRLALLGEWRPNLNPQNMPAEIVEALAGKGASVFGPPPTFGAAPEHAALAAKWIGWIRDGVVPVDRLYTTRSRADEAPLEMKRLATGVKSMLGVVLDWEAEG